MNILLIGYYGYHNLGDDLMLNGIIKILESNSSICNITVPVKECYYTFQNNKILQIPLPNNYNKWYQLIKNNDLIIWGGGTCLYANPGLNWLLIISYMIFVLRKKLYFIGVGVDYPDSFFDRTKIRTILNVSSKIGIRDSTSVENCINLYHINSNKISRIDDLAYLSLPTKKIKLYQSNTTLKKISFSGHYDFISEETINFYATLITTILYQNTELELHFLPAHCGQNSDNRQHTLIYRKIPNCLKNRIFLYPNLSSDYFMTKLSEMDFHIGFRLHSIFLSNNLSIPFLAINYAPKVESYVKSINGNYINLHIPFGYDLINKINIEKRQQNINIAEVQYKIRKTFLEIIFS